METASVVWLRSWEKEILGLIPALEISEQTSIAILGSIHFFFLR
jgi:hypothetical protein